MTAQNPAPSPSGERPIGAGFLVAGLVAIGAGLLLPLLLGSFSRRQTIVLALVEAVCLAAIATGILLMARRLRTSRDALWALARRDELSTSAWGTSRGTGSSPRSARR